MSQIAQLAAPMLWFSPDEPGMYNADGLIQLPQALPYDTGTERPIVYYKVRKIYTEQKKLPLRSGAIATNSK